MNLKDRIETVCKWLEDEYGLYYDEVDVVADFENPIIAVAYTDLYDENEEVHSVQIYYDAEMCELVYCIVVSDIPFITEEIHREYYDPEWIVYLPYDALFEVYNDKFGWT